MAALIVSACTTGSAPDQTTIPDTEVSSPPTTQEPITTVRAGGLDLTTAEWVTHGPDGIRLDDRTLIWETLPFPTGLARDREGGLVYSDSSGLWWFRAGETAPSRVNDVNSEMVAVVDTASGPAAMVMEEPGLPTFYALADGQAVPEPNETPLWSTGWLWSTTADNGLRAYIVEPEIVLNQESQPAEIEEPGHFAIADRDQVIVDLIIGDLDEPWVTLHDFDGQRAIVSRGALEPANPEETFFLIDLSTGALTEVFVAAATRASFVGADSDWAGPVATDFTA